MSKEWEPDDIFDVLASRTARTILVLASRDHLSVRELAAESNWSKPTIYRRVDTLVEYDLLIEERRIDSQGNHYSVYRTNLDRICFDVTDEELEVSIRLRRDLVDRFDDLWSALENHDDSRNT